ncbi:MULTISPECIES: hypothetical protein [Pseudomonas]|uniref:Uncharacterized protein n=1 Tax=Pseudomonas reactans TaxID=117680 RepID=A0A7Y8FZJ0_9PSED|nr:hypothetical protein [Pseudomonas reactans]NWE87960.1 hypothetical protein [Pseudomonas reactans]
MSPAMAAQFDWMTLGAFSPERFSGDERKEYEEAARRIQRQWDNQPS